MHEALLSVFDVYITVRSKRAKFASPECPHSSHISHTEQPHKKNEANKPPLVNDKPLILIQHARHNERNLAARAHIINSTRAPECDVTQNRAVVLMCAFARGGEVYVS